MSSASISPMYRLLRMAAFRWGNAACFTFLICQGIPVFGQADQQVYTDSLQNGWQNWGWATLNYNNSSPVHSGADSIAVTVASYQAIYISHTAFDSTPFSSLSFWINGGAAGSQKLQVQALLGSTAQTPVVLAPLPTNSWQHLSISLSSLGVAGQGNFTGFWIQDRIGAAQPTFLSVPGSGASWSPLNTVVGVFGSRFTITNAMSSPAAFYRLRSR